MKCHNIYSDKLWLSAVTEIATGTMGLSWIVACTCIFYIKYVQIFDMSCNIVYKCKEWGMS